MESSSSDDKDLREKYEELQKRYIRLLEVSYERSIAEREAISNQFQNQKATSDRLATEVQTLKHKAIQIERDLKTRSGIAIQQRNDVITWLAKEAKSLPKRKCPPVLKKLSTLTMENMDDDVFTLLDLIEDIDAHS